MTEQIREDFFAVLDKYGHSHDREAASENLRAWERNKAPLLELLRRHPDWNEGELAVTFDVTENRGVDRREIYDARDDALRLRRGPGGALADFAAALSPVCGEMSRNIGSEGLPARLMEICGVRCAVGQKTSRAINAVCRKFGADGHPEYNRLFARLADAFNPLNLKRRAALSVHPCDFLEMSNRDNSWRSCHRLDGGEYMAGTLSYMNDGASMIFYTMGDGAAEGFHRRPKLKRQVFCWSGGMLLQSRLYPDAEREEDMLAFRNAAQRAIAGCLDEPNIWRLSKQFAEFEDRFKTAAGALHYRDYEFHYNHPTMSCLRGADAGPAMSIGHEAYCLKCGGALDDRGSLECEGQALKP